MESDLVFTVIIICVGAALSLAARLLVDYAINRFWRPKE